MKKIYTLLAGALLLALPTLFASCDDDDWYDDWYDDGWVWGGNYNDTPDGSDQDSEDFYVAMAQTLAGQWRGTLTAYAIAEDSTIVDTMEFDTDIEFVQYNSSSVSGTGTQWDFTPGTDNCEYERTFTWAIDTECGDILITYKTLNDDNTYTPYSMIIPYDELNLDDRTFTGYLVSEDGAEVDDFWFNRYNATSSSNSKAATRAAKGKTIKKFVMVLK